MNEAISNLIVQAKVEAHNYACAYPCSDAIRPAIEAQHFVRLINDALSTIKDVATEYAYNAILGISREE